MIVGGSALELQSRPQEFSISKFEDAVKWLYEE